MSGAGQRAEKITERATTSPLLCDEIVGAKIRVVSRQVAARDRKQLHDLVALDGLFEREEVDVARELVDAAIDQPGGEYRLLVAEVTAQQKTTTGRIVGYICYGPTPMTEGTWDLYWVVTHPEARGRGVASNLVAEMEAQLRKIGARQLRVETSQLETYGAAHEFYARRNYEVISRFPDFYKPGDDLLTLLKRL